MSKRIQALKRSKSNNNFFPTSPTVVIVVIVVGLLLDFSSTIRAFSTTTTTTKSSRLSLLVTTRSRRQRHHGGLVEQAAVVASIYSLYSTRTGSRSRRFSTRTTTAAAATESSAHDKSSSSMLSLNDFLHDCKTRIHQNQRQQQYHLVIGNEAGDADSIISALTLAHVEALRSAFFATTTDISDAAANKMLMLPIVSIPEKDLATQRPETLLLLKLAGISLDNLIFVNQLNDTLLPSAASDRSLLLHLTLVDHNHLSSNLFQNNDYKVMEILDHHYDEGAHVDSCPLLSSRRLIAFENTMANSGSGEGSEKGDKNHHHHQGGGALVASTCTLVAERLISIWDEHHRSRTDALCENTDIDSLLLSSSSFPPCLALVLLGTILLDSVNMSPAAGKGTERDAKAITRLLQGTDWSSLPPQTLQQLPFTTTPQLNQDEQLQEQQQQQQQQHPDTTALFQVLQNAKFDLEFWKSLTVRDALNLDYKQFTAESSPQQQDKNKESSKTSSSNSYTFGLSTVLMPMDEFLLKPNVRQEILSYMQQEEHVDFLGIMLTFSDDSSVEDSGGKQIRRQMILCATSTTTLQDNLLQEIMDFFVHKKHDGDELEIQEIQPTAAAAAAAVASSTIKEDHDDGLTLRFVNQGNTNSSRKIVAPIFLQFFEQKLCSDNVHKKSSF